MNERIVWRVDQIFLRGTHSFVLQDRGNGSTLVRHVVQVELSWWFALVWRFYVAGMHDRIVGGLLDRLTAGAKRMGSDKEAA